jgi:hypothetical protein
MLLFFTKYCLYLLASLEDLQLPREAYRPPWRAKSTSTHAIFSSFFLLGILIFQEIDPQAPLNPDPQLRRRYENNLPVMQTFEHIIRVEGWILQ